jgi:hypothetical protein
MASYMELSFLKALYDRPGPFATVYLDMRRTEAPRAIEVRQHVRCKELADQGAPPETVEVVERFIRDERERREFGCLAVFAAGEEIVHSDLLGGRPRADLATYAPLPHVVPLLQQRGEPVSWLVAVANRLGARITYVSADGDRCETVVPPSVASPVHKTKGCDMTRQAHGQRAAEDSWRTNAKRVAQAVEQFACSAEVIVLAGDVRARADVLKELTEPTLARTVESERSGGPSLEADVRAAVERRRDARIADAMERFYEQLTRGGRAADGQPAVVKALRNAQVASLLVDRCVAAPVWTGPRCTDLATSPRELRDLGVPDPIPSRADAALVRALAGTDGELLLVTVDGWRATEGLGALLRYGGER